MECWLDSLTSSLRFSCSIFWGYDLAKWLIWYLRLPDWVGVVSSRDISRFPSLGIPRLELENPRWNTYVGHWNSYVGIPMSNVGIPMWVFSFLPRFLPNLMIFQCILYQWMMIKVWNYKNHQIRQKSGQKWENLRWNSYVGHWNSNVQHRYSNQWIRTRWKGSQFAGYQNVHV